MEKACFDIAMVAWMKIWLFQTNPSAGIWRDKAMKHDNVQREFELSMLVVKRSMSSGLLDSGCYVYIFANRAAKK